MQPVVGVMDVLATWLENATTVISSVFSWLGDLVTFVTSHPFIWIPMIISIVTAVVLSIGKALLRG